MSLTELNAQIHAQIGELLLQHLEALTALDLEKARRLWTQFAAALTRHSEIEDEMVIPTYEQSGDLPEGGKPAFFTAEHANLHRLLTAIEANLNTLDSGDPTLRRQIVLNLDSYVQLRNLLQHHTLREQNLLYPTLDARTDNATRRTLEQALEP